MTLPVTDRHKAPDTVVRQPSAVEIPRAVHLLRNARLRPGSRLLVAEKTRPIPRFVGAAAWWAEESIGRFQLVWLPGLAHTAATEALIAGVVNEARAAGLAYIQYADFLTEGNLWLSPLRAQGFERVRSERSFETASRETWMRIHRLYERHKTAIPPGWRTDPIREHGPEVILNLIAPHRLLTPEDVKYCWQATAAAGFDPEMSCILFDRERPFGAFLARRPADVLYVDVQVVAEPNPRLRSLGDLCLVYHVVRRVGPDGPIHWIRFRCGETEHRQTANLALRMGGRELTRMHVFGKRLAPQDDA